MGRDDGGKRCEDRAVLSGVEIAPDRLAALCQLWQEQGHQVWTTVSGGSMVPVYLPGTRLLLRFGKLSPRRREVVVFLQDGKLVVHRVVDVRQASAERAAHYVCRGDGNRVPDPLVERDAVVAAVLEVAPIRFGRRLICLARYPRRHLRYFCRRFWGGASE